MLVRTQYLSLDPANRGWMMMPTYIPQVPLGATMWGFVLGRVEQSNVYRVSRPAIWSAASAPGRITV